eukprot:CAMPEP_0174694092 /NCGR_PEP_ID=MMETSP1094-20130205/729_1 /TAXON_ID=156173 /ORGANISM="Chrysochromulina brevifilum, Strain UTEX LB 985" /LENGTH=173 /DNA_ID=CAMNT_0015890231 /DNA_START=450 /DNA_END=971 /DNA_ORIENTATION=-
MKNAKHDAGNTVGIPAPAASCKQPELEAQQDSLLPDLEAERDDLLPESEAERTDLISYLEAMRDELLSELKCLKLESELTEAKQELAQLRAQRPRRVRWADTNQGCLAEPVGSPRPPGGIRCMPLYVRPVSRRHIYGTERPPSKLSPVQIAQRKRLVGQMVRGQEGKRARARA